MNVVKLQDRINTRNAEFPYTNNQKKIRKKLNSKAAVSSKNKIHNKPTKK